MNKYEVGNIHSDRKCDVVSAASVAAMQRLNSRARILDSSFKRAVYNEKIKVSEALCKSGYCIRREIDHRHGHHETICKLFFQVGSQHFQWALPTRKILFDVIVRNPAAEYRGSPADNTRIALMSDHELLQTVTKAKLAESKKKVVEACGQVVSDEQQVAWYKEFYKNHSRCPRCNECYPPGNPLGKIAAQWRASYKRGVLDWRLVEQLNELKFPWDGKSQNWFIRYFQVREFIAEHGRWPHSSGIADNECELASWLFMQRHMYRNGSLDPNKKWLLDHLNFDWGGYSRQPIRYRIKR